MFLVREGFFIGVFRSFVLVFSLSLESMFVFFILGGIRVFYGFFSFFSLCFFYSCFYEVEFLEVVVFILEWIFIVCLVLGFDGTSEGS